MKKKYIAIFFAIIGSIIAIWLGGCTEYPVIQGDSNIRAIQLHRRWDAAKECANITGKSNAIACAEMNAVCEITMSPDDTNEILGHEVRHCFDGYWHR